MAKHDFGQLKAELLELLRQERLKEVIEKLELAFENRPVDKNDLIPVADSYRLATSLKDNGKLTIEIYRKRMEVVSRKLEGFVRRLPGEVLSQRQDTTQLTTQGFSRIFYMVALCLATGALIFVGLVLDPSENQPPSNPIPPPCVLDNSGSLALFDQGSDQYQDSILDAYSSLDYSIDSLIDEFIKRNAEYEISQSLGIEDILIEVTNTVGDNVHDRATLSFDEDPGRDEACSDSIMRSLKSEMIAGLQKGEFDDVFEFMRSCLDDTSAQESTGLNVQLSLLLIDFYIRGVCDFSYFDKRRGELCGQVVSLIFDLEIGQIKDDFFRDCRGGDR